jgi:hypothetical protein
MDGDVMPSETIVDQLTKEILFSSGNLYGSTGEPGLQIGAWDRGFGLKGGRVDEVSVYDRELTPFEVKVISKKAAWAVIATKDRNDLSSEDLDKLRAYYEANVHAGLVENRKQLKKLRWTLADSLEPVQELMVMQEMASPKRAFILNRGSYDAPGEQVSRNTPDAVLPFPDELPRDRYGLAQWLTRGDHPLTARVAVNRLWQSFFGTGLVKTSEDFGNQGELPSHPLLLDWLALTFIQSGWSVKELNKLIVMSAAYRRDSRATAGMREADPENRLLARGPSFRLTAEMIRDNALASSGLLNMRVGGKSVKPYQPDGLWQINNASYTPDTGKAVYRRSLYVLVKRSVPNPTLATFDATSRSYCVVRRQKTNTPLQALVTLNDPTFVEASCVLGQRMADNADVKKSISETFRKLTGRAPSEKEIAVLEELRDGQLKQFRKNPEKARGWLASGQSVVGDQYDQAVIAANAVVASTIINSDASLTRR